MACSRSISETTGTSDNVEKEKFINNPEQSVYLLNHEYIHFDITELFARKFRQKILQIKPMHYKKTIAEIDRLFTSIINEMDIEQSKYDKESDHSRNEGKQMIWSKKVPLELKKFEKYKSIRIAIFVKT